MPASISRSWTRDAVPPVTAIPRADIARTEASTRPRTVSRTPGALRRATDRGPLAHGLRGSRPHRHQPHPEPGPQGLGPLDPRCHLMPNSLAGPSMTPFVSARSPLGARTAAWIPIAPCGAPDDQSPTPSATCLAVSAARSAACFAASPTRSAACFAASPTRSAARLVASAPPSLESPGIGPGSPALKGPDGCVTQTSRSFAARPDAPGCPSTRTWAARER